MSTTYKYITLADGTKIQVDSARRDKNGKLIHKYYASIDEVDNLVEEVLTINDDLISYNITNSITNGSASGDTTIVEDSTATVTISAYTGYDRPTSVSVVNATLVSYNSSTGVVTISNPQDNVTITATCVAKTYNITATITNGTKSGASTITYRGRASITINANSGYGRPVFITSCSGATISSYNWTSGVVSLTNCTGNVTVTAECLDASWTVLKVSPVSRTTYVSSSQSYSDNFEILSITATASGTVNYYKISSNKVSNSYSYSVDSGTLALAWGTCNVSSVTVVSTVTPDIIIVKAPHSKVATVSTPTAKLSSSYVPCVNQLYQIGSGISDISGILRGQTSVDATVYIPSTVSTIGSFAFYDSNVSTLRYSGTYSDWYNCSFGSDWANKKYTLYVNGTNISSYSSSILSGKTQVKAYQFMYLNSNIVIPTTITSIGSHAFDNCSLSSGTRNLSNVTSIGTYAFNGCSNVSAVTLNSSITSIPTYAFSGTALTTITLPSSVTTVGAYALNCSNLSTAYVGLQTDYWYFDTTQIPISDVSNASTMATYFKSTYVASAFEHTTSPKETAS